MAFNGRKMFQGTITSIIILAVVILFIEHGFVRFIRNTEKIESHTTSEMNAHTEVPLTKCFY